MDLKLMEIFKFNGKTQKELNEKVGSLIIAKTSETY